MIICRDCGNTNEEGDDFCGSCGSFLEFTGEATEQAKAKEFASVTPAGTFIEKIKKVNDGDNDAIARQTQQEEEMRRADAELAEARATAARAAADAAKEAELRREDEQRREQEAEVNRLRLAEEAKRREAEAQRLREQEAGAAEERARFEAEQAKAAADEKRLAEEALARAEEQRQLLANEEAQRTAARKAAEHLAAQREAEALARSRAEHAAMLTQTEAAQQNEEQLQALHAQQQLAAQQELERIEIERRHAEELAAVEAERVRANEELRRIENEQRAKQEQAAAAERQQLAKTQQLLREKEEQLRKQEELRELAAEEHRKREAERERLEADRQRREDEQKQKDAERRAVAEAEKLRTEEELKRISVLIAKPDIVHPDLAATKPSSASSAAASKATATKPDKQKAVEAAIKPNKEKVRSGPTVVTTNDINHGDLVCAQCGTGNAPSRKFCKKCGFSLSEAAKAKNGILRRIANKFRRKQKQFEAGTRRRTADGRMRGDGKLKSVTRRAYSRFTRTLFRIGAVLGIAAMFGLGVEPIRAKLHLPNVRQTILNKVRGVATPIFDPVRPTSVSASNATPTFPATQVMDLANNTYWASAPSSAGGVGSTLTFVFAKPVDLDRLLITSGASADDPAEFVNRPRASELRLRVNGDETTSKTLKLGDKATPQSLTYVQDEVRRLDITVSAIYPSVKPTKAGVAITEIELFTKRKFGDDYETLKASGPKLMTDDDPNTVWLSPPTDDGVGSTFTLTFPGPIDIDRLRFNVGLSGPAFASGPRPKEIQVVLTCVRTCPPTAQIKLKNKAESQTVKLVGRGVTSLQFQIRSVNGTGGPAAIREVAAQRLRPKQGA